MIVMLLFLYPMLGANQLVGTDLTQAVPLTRPRRSARSIFGHVEFGVTVSLILGSVPAVLIGSMFSSSAPDRYVRPVITFVITASGLKYVGLDTETLGWTLCGILLAVALFWVWNRRPWEAAAWEERTSRGVAERNDARSSPCPPTVASSRAPPTSPLAPISTDLPRTGDLLPETCSRSCF